jgi:hypothetical protein
LGAGIAVDTARRPLLGEALPSGRFYVDLKKLVAAEAAATLPDWDILEESEISQAPPAVAMPAAPQGVVDWALQRCEAEYIVSHACLAPSGGNSQLWHFTIRQGRIDCSILSTDLWTTLGFEGRSLYVAMGAAIENMAIAARAIGLQAQFKPAQKNDPAVVCRVTFERVPPLQSPYLAAIPKRITNGHHADLGKHLADAKLEKLVNVASQCGAKLQFVQDDTQKKKIARVIGAVDRVRILHPDLHRDLTSAVRWAREHAHTTGSGIGIDTLELDTTDRLGAYLTTTWPAMQVLLDRGLGDDLEKPARECKSHAYGLLTMPGEGLATYLAGGRAMQQVWLESTLQDVAFCPTSSSLYLFARLEQGGDEIYSQAGKDALRTARREFLEVFPQMEPACEILLFRLSEAPAPTAHSLRRPLSQMLTIENASSASN